MSEKLLLDSMVKRARAHTKVYTLRDGGGLQVIVHPNGKKYFQLRYSFGGRPRLMQLGPYPSLSLERARTDAQMHRDALRLGHDPITARRLGKLHKIAETEGTFASIMMQWLKRNQKEWSERNYQRHVGLLRLWLLPQLGALPIKAIDTVSVLSVLREIEAAGVLHTAHQALTTARMIFDFAISIGVLQFNPADRLHKALPRRPKAQHHPALAIDQVGPMLRTLEASGSSPVTKAAIRLALLTGLRDTSLRTLTWGDVDLAGAQLTVRAANMKGRREFSTPLPKQAIAVLKELHALTFRGPDSYLFPGSGKNARVSPSTLGDALKRTGHTVTTHGMRSLLNTYLAECGFRLEAREAQLAHVHGDQTDQAYMRSNFWPHRVEMMQHWGDVVTALEAGKPVPRVEVDNVRRIRAA